MQRIWVKASLKDFSSFCTEFRGTESSWRAGTLSWSAMFKELGNWGSVQNNWQLQLVYLCKFHNIWWYLFFHLDYGFCSNSIKTTHTHTSHSCGLAVAGSKSVDLFLQENISTWLTQASFESWRVFSLCPWSQSNWFTQKCTDFKALVGFRATPKLRAFFWRNPGLQADAITLSVYQPAFACEITSNGVFPERSCRTD